MSQDQPVRDRLEALTCRPVVDGKRILPSQEVIRWKFWIETLTEPIGRFTYFDLNPRNRSAEFGYNVNPKYRNQGFGTEMVSFAITHIFNTPHFNKLYCQTCAFNQPYRDGILREHHELDGVLLDDYIYSILRREWTHAGSTRLTFTVET